ncbi:MAG: hypothetical protein K2Y12_03865 [Chitinophagaceae bacterium]|nr:hypothetical protein [Chitinophagaceae bacterium]
MAKITIESIERTKHNEFDEEKFQQARKTAALVLAFVSVFIFFIKLLFF